MTAISLSPRSLRGLRALLSPDEALRAGPAVVGGKAHALARLAHVELEIPAWLVLPASSLDLHLRAGGVHRQVARTLEELRGVSGDQAAVRRAITSAARQLQSLVAEIVLDPALEDELRQAAELLAPGPFAVRSSAVGEDGARHSWAGQFATVLGVTGQEQILAGLRQCWQSAFSERALDYRLRARQLNDAAQIAVIFQRMVAADVAGVLFTTDPTTGFNTHMRVSACLGLGEGLVSGDYDADEYVVDADGREVSARVANKTRRTVLAESGAVEEAVPAARRDRRALSPLMLRKLSAAGKRIATAEGGPRDVEWAIIGNELYILQARPITAMRREQAPEHRIVWDNSNIQESYFGVTTPLTFSFARAAYASVYEQTMRTLGISERVIAEHRGLLNNLLGLIRGRVYYNLDNWYRGLRLLPAFRRNKEDMERMMGVEEPVDFVEDEKLGLVERVMRALRLLPALLRLLLRFAMLDHSGKRFLAHIEDCLGEIDRATLVSRGLGDLMPLLDRLRAECIDRWTPPIVNDFFVMMSTGRLRRLVERARQTDAADVMQTLLGGADVETSAGPAMLLLQLAGIARKEPALARLLDGTDHARVLAALREASTRFNGVYEELVARFGDRCMGELKLESRPLRDDPRFVVEMLRNYVGGSAPDAAVVEERARVEREYLELQIEESLGIVARTRFRRALIAARRGIRRREEMRLTRTRLFGVHRDIYRAIGCRLAEARRLGRADDVFYLTTQEIAAYWEGTAVSNDLASIADARRREFAAYRHLSAPNRIVTTGAPLDSPVFELQQAAPAAGRVLEGLGCSPGVAEGPVRIITSPDDDLALAGHVLVAPRTDPGWAPLFPSAAAIVVERGSLLSHSAVLARELGLPAVVGIPGVVQQLRDGERVRVDGSTGRIVRLEVECAS
jgi:pyruvate,water dikinase